MWNVSKLVASHSLRKQVISYVRNNQNVVLDFRISNISPQVPGLMRAYSNRKGFLENLVDTIKQEYNKDTDLKENIKKFRKEAQELEDSEALKRARQKFDDISKETAQSSEVIHEALGKVKTKISEAADEIGKSDLGKAAGRLSGGITDAARQATESEAFKKVQAGVQSIAEGSGVAPSSLYRPPGFTGADSFIHKPWNQIYFRHGGIKQLLQVFLRDADPTQQCISENIRDRASVVVTESGGIVYLDCDYIVVLRMRKEELDPDVERIIEANTDATNIVMHKDSVWNQQWESFKNSKVGERISEMKMRFDESDNVFIRSSRFVTDRISGIAGGLFGGTDISKIMTEIERIQPGFSGQAFLDVCRCDIIPNVLEAIAHGKDKIVKDWCSEAPYNQLMFPVKQAETIGCRFEVKIVDLDHVDIAGATKVDQGPVLVISFQTQQINVVRNKKGEVVDGDENQILRVYHVWALCRDLDELDPRAAWKIIDQSSSSAPMLL